MAITKLTPNLVVASVEEAAAFYGTFGFIQVMQVPAEGVADFAILTAGEVELMLQSVASIAEDLPPVAALPLGGGVILYLEVDDVAAVHAALPAGASVIVPLRQTFYGSTEFYIQDPNGYVVGFAQPGTD